MSELPPLPKPFYSDSKNRCYELSYSEEQMQAYAREARALAATTAPAPTEPLKPLTPAQRRELINRAGDITDGLNQDDFADEIVKLTEQAHGIRATPPSAVEAAQPANFAGEIAYQLTKRLVIDMPTARSIIDDAIRAAKGDKL